MKHEKNQKLLNEIPQEEITRLKGNILNFCTTNPKFIEHSNLSNYRLIFANYDFEACQLHKFTDKSLTKSLMERLGEITKYNGGTFSQSGLQQKKISDAKEYKDLIKHIPQDENLFHIDLGSKARLFYYTTANFFCVVAVTLDHR